MERLQELGADDDVDCVVVAIEDACHGLDQTSKGLFFACFSCVCLSLRMHASVHAGICAGSHSMTFLTPARPTGSAEYEHA